jgi:photosystem II biogenesis protein Psp29
MDLWHKVGAIAERPKFKYSRLFAIGLYTFLSESEPDLLKSEEDGPTLLEKISVALALPDEKLKKDLEIYRSNLEKMSQVLEAIEDTIQADRKRREQKQAETVAAIDG